MPYIIKTMNEITRCGKQFRNARLAPLGLKSAHASYLIEICRSPGISQDMLAKRICFNKSNIARQIAVLENDGFVLRKASSEDKRVMELYPTEKAHALLPQISDILKCWETCITSDLTDGEKALLSELLAKMKLRAADYMEGR